MTEKQQKTAEISEQHRRSKQEGYWGDLDVGSTTRYKSEKIEELIGRFFSPSCDSILDVGSGSNCHHILKYRDILGARRIACLDYDERLIAKMRERFSGEGIKWEVADIFKLQDFREKFDLVFLLDVLHEIYSFYGRPSRNESEPIDSSLGLDYVVKAMGNIANIVNPRGGIVITDNILPSQKGHVTVRTKSKEVNQAVNYFFRNYPTRRFETVSKERNRVTLRPSDLSVLLSQYNKIKNKDWSRWNVERSEQHQYMTKEEYGNLFHRLGFDVNMIIETPEYVRREWEEDFEILDGLDDFPPKRVTLLAIKKKKFKI